MEMRKMTLIIILIVDEKKNRRTRVEELIVDTNVERIIRSRFSIERSKQKEVSGR